MSLQWRDQLSVANDLIDGDHQHLIEIINLAEVSLQAHNPGELSRVLQELHRYGKSHFEREEQIARAIQFPRADSLHESHQELSHQLEKFRDEVGEQWSEAAIQEFSTFLRNWLINHVIKEDMLMKPWLQRFSPRFDPR